MWSYSGALNIPDNTWVKMEPTPVLTGDFADGSLGSDMWGCFTYVHDEGKIFQRGAFRDAQRTTSIYDNCYLSWDIAANVLTVEQVTAWVGGSHEFHELSSQAGETPMNKHIYNGYTYVAGKRAIYEVGGAFSGNCTPSCDAKILWIYSLDTKTWRKGPRCDAANFETHLRYIPGLDRLFYFTTPRSPDNRIYEYDPEQDTWSLIDSYVPNRWWQGSSTVDTKRNLVVFHGDDHDNTHPNIMASYNPVTNTWTTISTNPPFPRGRIVYNSKWDVYICMGTMEAQTWIYNPNTSQFSQVQVAGPHPVYKQFHSVNGYSAYDEKNDVIAVKNIGTDRYVFRYVPEGNAVSNRQIEYKIKNKISNVKIYNIHGKLVKKLTSNIFNQTTLHANNLPSGIYYIHAKAGDKVLVKSIILMK
jgi:hypothetical protein